MTPERLIIESMFKIVDKDGKDVPFLLNTYQAALDNTLSGRDIIPKARQLGMSAYVLARFTAKCLSVKNTRAVVISHDRESTERMLARVHYYLNNLRSPRAVIKNSSKSELTFPKTNSMFYLGTAGSRKFGRGDTITDLHCSEIAYWDDPKPLVAGLFQAVPRGNGEIFIESTGNGTGNYYHRACMRAYEGIGRFKLHFFDWLKAEEYRIPLTEEEKAALLTNLKEEWEEIELYKRGLTLEQLAFRREKLEEFDYDLQQFKAEYPLTLDECFQATGYSMFSVVPYVPTDEWVQFNAYGASIDLRSCEPIVRTTGGEVGEMPKVGFWALRDQYKHRSSRYAIGVDVGGGVRRDRSVIEVVDIHKWEQVAEYVADNVSPDILARRIIQLGLHYNDAYVGVETNNHGAVTLLKLLEGFPKDGLAGYPQHLIYMSQKSGDSLLSYGWKTTQRTKPILIGALRKEFCDGLKIHSPLLKDELSTYVEDENGKMNAQEGCFDDRVIAIAVAVQAALASPYIYERERLEKAKREYVDPLNVGLLIDELRMKHAERKGEFAIPAQDDADADIPYLLN